MQAPPHLKALGVCKGYHFLQCKCIDFHAKLWIPDVYVEVLLEFILSRKAWSSKFDKTPAAHSMGHQVQKCMVHLWTCELHEISS